MSYFPLSALGASISQAITSAKLISPVPRVTQNHMGWILKIAIRRNLIAEESFIDDDELQVCTPSPVSSSMVGDEITSESSNPKKKKGHGKQLKKRSQVVESDDDDNSRKSEDEDGYLLSIFKSKKDVKNDFTRLTTRNFFRSEFIT